MADKQPPRMFVEALSLSTKKFDALCEQNRREKIAKVLARRRKRWKQRHNAIQEFDRSLKDEKEQLEELLGDLELQLVTRRDQGMEAAMRLQNEEAKHALETFRHRLTNETGVLQSYATSRPDSSLSVPVTTSSFNSAIVKDLEATLSQAEALAEIRKMKHTMTPKVPQLHNRTLSGNIFDQSLGVLHDSVLDSSGIATEMLDSEHAHLQIIGKEVSISQEESEVLSSEDQRCPPTNQQPWEGGGSGGLGISDSSSSSPEKFACADDTPGIGMEVVCAEVPDSSMTVTAMPHLPEPSTNHLVTSHNGMVNGFGESSSPSPPPSSSPHKLPCPSISSMENNVHLSPGKVAELDLQYSEREAESELEANYHKLLQRTRESNYDLRFAQRHQTGAGKSTSSSSTKASKATGSTKASSSHRTPGSAKTSSGSRAAGTPTSSTTRKRGRPRKYPLQQTPTAS